MGLPTRICELRERIPAGDPPRNELSAGVRPFGKVQGSRSFCFHFLPLENIFTNGKVKGKKRGEEKKAVIHLNAFYLYAFPSNSVSCVLITRITCDISYHFYLHHRSAQICIIKND